MDHKLYTKKNDHNIEMKVFGINFFVFCIVVLTIVLCFTKDFRDEGFVVKDGFVVKEGFGPYMWHTLFSSIAKLI